MGSDWACLPLKPDLGSVLPLPYTRVRRLLILVSRDPSAATHPLRLLTYDRAKQNSRNSFTLTTFILAKRQNAYHFQNPKLQKGCQIFLLIKNWHGLENPKVWREKGRILGADDVLAQAMGRSDTAWLGYEQ